ncbi:MAG: AIR synthase-related protein [Desulfosalsimonadaceae bacterium]|nr:AIR synthase-related protein [Desulfosalsimonadaceae bacterium]
MRKICFDVLNLKIDSYVPEFGKTLGEELITPTKIYAEMILHLIKDLPIHGLAHITGGGIDDNIVRVLPQSCSVEIKRGSWTVPAIFSFLKQAGNVEDLEMTRTFNNGIGMIAVVPDAAAQDVVERLAAMNEKAYVIGEVVQTKKNAEKRVLWV